MADNGLREKRKNITYHKKQDLIRILAEKKFDKKKYFKVKK